MNFYQLLGVMDGLGAAESWPRNRVQDVLGVTNTSPSSFLALMQYLQGSLQIRNVVPGAAVDPAGVGPKRVGLHAEVEVRNTGAPRPLVLRQMPDVSFHLIDTALGKPARLFVTRSTAGVEVVLEGLPVEIKIPSDLLGPLPTPEQEATPPPSGQFEIRVTPDPVFAPGVLDSLEVVLRSSDPSSIKVHVRVRMTEEGDFVVEPAVPLSIGPCTFALLPCRAIHDLALLPAPYLNGAHEQEEMAIEWARHRLDRGLNPTPSGLYAVRTLDLDTAHAPLDELVKRLKTNNNERVELVLEDLALPVTSVLPFPVHGRAGIRRVQVEPDEEAMAAWDHSLAPVHLDFGDYRLKIFRLLIQTPADPAARDLLDASLALVRLEQGQPMGTESASALRLDVSDDGLIQLGFQLPLDGPPLFSLANLSFRFLAVRLGVEPGYRVTDRLRDGYKHSWTDHVQFLVDVSISGAPDAEKSETFALTNRAGGPIKAVLRNVGWDRGRGPLGGLSGELWLPEGIEIVAARLFRLGVDEFGYFTDHNGGRYISFTGQVPMLLRGLERSLTEEEKKDGSKHGVRYERLRFRVGGNPDAPRVLLDGLSLNVKIGSVGLKGFGVIREYRVLEDLYKEFGFGLEADFVAFSKRLLLGLGFYLGHVKGPSRDFRYWLFALRLGTLPLPSFYAEDVRVLAAGNLHPKLPQPDGKPPAMRLFRWYKSQPSDPLVLPEDRRLTAWESEDDSFSVGAAMKLFSAVSGRSVMFNLFALVTRSPLETSILAGVEAWIFQSDPQRAPTDGNKPIAYGALELNFQEDGTKFGFLLAADFKMTQFLGRWAPSWLPSPRFSGMFFVSNEPDTLALGFINDPSTWPSIGFKTKRWVDIEVFLGGCYHVTEGPPKVNAVGLLFVAKAGKKFSVGEAQFYLTAGAFIGLWRNESQSFGLLVWLEGGIRIKLFKVFRVSLEAKIELDCIWPQDYKRLAFELRIGTPWWLPDVTLRFQHVWGAPEPEKLETLSLPLGTGTALGPDRNASGGVLVQRLGGEPDDPKALYSIEGLRGLAPAEATSQALDALPLVSVDSTISLDLRVAVDSHLTVVGPTPPGASEQKTEDFTAHYELKSVGIRRRPRYGTGSPAWTTLLAPSSTTYGDTTATFTPQVTFHWDGDLVRESRLDPRRLLVNAATPYTLATEDQRFDDIRLDSSPGWPCLVAQDGEPLWHTLNFENVPLGRRVPRVQRFSESSSTVHWQIRPLPVAVTSQSSPPVRAARIAITAPKDKPVTTKIAVLHFDFPARLFEISVRLSGEIFGDLIVETYRGLDLLQEKVFTFPANLPPVIGFEEPDGLTAIVLRARTYEGGGEQVPALEIREMRYRTVQEVLDDELLDDLTETEHDRVVGGGKLAWLPNHDYEITLTSRAELEHARSGRQDAPVTQRAYFRTRGLPGLNRTARVGDEMEPYVESRYPVGPPRALYRMEPVALAFDERFNILAPTSVDPTLPPERRQVVEWALVAEAVGGSESARRLSRIAGDWLSANSVPSTPEPAPSPVLVESGFLTRAVRQAETRDPILGRLERLLQSPFSCGVTTPQIHKSQVLLHKPVDLGAAPGAPQLWPAAQTLRLRLQALRGPFAERRGFTAGDETAFQQITETGAPATWSVDEETLTCTAPAGGRRYALFGQPSWMHLQIVATLETAGAAFGVAVAVSGTVSQALLALIDESGTTPRLQLLAKRGTNVTTLATADLPAATGTRQLHVTAFDDVVRARVDEVVVEAPRRDLREGKVALVSTGGGRLHELLVEPVDAYELVVQTSRYADFPAHIGSFSGTAGDQPLARPAGTLLPGRNQERSRVMVPEADPEERQRVFESWARELGAALRERPQRLELTRLTSADGTEALLLESPEPLPFSDDVSLQLEGEQSDGTVTTYELRILTDGSETHALVIPVDESTGEPVPLPAAEYRLLFAMDRVRFRSAVPDPLSRYQAQATLETAW